MRVFNNTDRALSVERWTIFPKSSRCMNQRGKVFMELPEDVAHSPIIRILEAQKVVVLPSFGKVKKDEPVKEVPKEVPSAKDVSGVAQAIPAPQRRTRGQG